ncbi:hypothetical protein KUTeg_005260 [Tegillarca granosa]|uniref:Uncharacterized protein n=1 Tax=Tegillarca granosa TaxID=220873 RepID=A0ABQ9FKZ2_TEGGR|nr:hypothetical protein KUTeg_005260 [Tegillarca granosa]
MAEGVIEIGDDDSESDIIVISDDEEYQLFFGIYIRPNLDPITKINKFGFWDILKLMVAFPKIFSKYLTMIISEYQKISIKTWCRLKREKEKLNKNKNNVNEPVVISSDESDGEFSDELPDLDESSNTGLTVETTKGAKNVSSTSNTKTFAKTGPIFDTKSREKLASILKNAKINIFKKSLFDDGKEENLSNSDFLKNDDGDSKHLKDETSSPSSNRHFLDLFQSENLETSSAESETNKKHSEKISSLSGSENGVKRSVFVTSSPSSKQQKKVKRKKTMQTTMDSYLPTQDIHVTDKNSDFKLIRQEKLKFPDNGDLESLVGNFSMLCINTVMMCLEDENEDALIQGLEIFNNFAQKYKPSEGIVTEILNRCLISAKSVELLFKGFNTLLFIHHTYPDLLNIAWDVVKEILDQIGIGRGMAHQDPTIITKMSLLLELAIICYEDDFYCRDLIDQRSVRKSYAFRFLSHDLCFERNVKHVINIVICLLTSGEFSEIDVDYLSSLRPEEQKQQQIEQSLNQIQMFEISKILPKMQKILEISVNISSSCCDAAKAIATELLKSYIYLPNTLKSELIMFKLIQLVLENCEGTLPGLDFPSNLNSLVECYFKALPPKNILTPPTTPQSEDEEQGVAAVSDSYSPAAVEELSVLLYYLIYSYLKCVQKKSHIALRRRARYSKAELAAVSPEIQENLTTLPQHVENLRRHFLMLTDITAKTQEYLKKMLCFSNLKYTHFGLHKSTVSHFGLHTSTFTHFGLHTSTITHFGLHTSTVTHFGLHTSTVTHFGLYTSTVTHFGLHTSTVTHFGLHTSTVTHFGLHTSTITHCGLHTSTVTHFGLHTSTITHFGLHTSTVTHFGLNTSTVTHWTFMEYINSYTFWTSYINNYTLWTSYINSYTFGLHTSTSYTFWTSYINSYTFWTSYINSYTFWTRNTSQLHILGLHTSTVTHFGLHTSTVTHLDFITSTVYTFWTSYITITHLDFIPSTVTHFGLHTSNSYTFWTSYTNRYTFGLHTSTSYIILDTSYINSYTFWTSYINSYTFWTSYINSLHILDFIHQQLHILDFIHQQFTHFGLHTSTITHFGLHTSTITHFGLHTSTITHFGLHTSTVTHFGLHTSTVTHFGLHTSTITHFGLHTSTITHFRLHTSTITHFGLHTSTVTHFGTSYINSYTFWTSYINSYTFWTSYINSYTFGLHTSTVTHFGLHTSTVTHFGLHTSTVTHFGLHTSTVTHFGLHTSTITHFRLHTSTITHFRLHTSTVTHFGLHTSTVTHFGLHTSGPNFGPKLTDFISIYKKNT